MHALRLVSRIALTSSTSQLYSTVASVTFAEYVRLGIEVTGSQTALGERLDLHSSRISRVLVAEGDSFDLPNCLLLAEVIGASPVDVLQAAGKADDAELLVRLFGQPREPIPPDEAEVLGLYRALEPAVQDAMRFLLRVQADPHMRHGLPPRVGGQRKQTVR